MVDDRRFWVIFDPDKKIATSTKLKEAADRYAQRFHQPPTEVLVNQSAADTRSAIPLKTASFVREHYFYFPYPD